MTFLTLQETQYTVCMSQLKKTRALKWLQSILKL